MATKIEWCDYTFNPWIGCAKVSAGCANCYAEAYSARYKRAIWGNGPDSTRVVTSDANWRKPHAWNRKAENDGTRPRVFCGSLCDVFEDRRELDEPRARLWELIAATPNLTWLVLTKRPENIKAMVPWVAGEWPSNVWAGTSVETEDVDARLFPLVVQSGCRRLFVSAEPMLGPLPFAIGLPVRHVIIGGESGPKARPMQLDWVRALISHCRADGIPVFVKQLGAWQAKRLGLKHPKGGDMSEWPEDLRIRELPDA